MNANLRNRYLPSPTSHLLHALHEAQLHLVATTILLRCLLQLLLVPPRLPALFRESLDPVARNMQQASFLKRRKKTMASDVWMLLRASFSTCVFAFSSKLADCSAAFCTSHHVRLMMSSLSRTEPLLFTQTGTSEAATDSLNCAKSCSAGSRMVLKQAFPELLRILNCKLGGRILLAVATKQESGEAKRRRKMAVCSGGLCALLCSLRRLQQARVLEKRRVRHNRQDLWLYW